MATSRACWTDFISSTQRTYQKLRWTAYHNSGRHFLLNCRSLWELYAGSKAEESKWSALRFAHFLSIKYRQTVFTCVAVPQQDRSIFCTAPCTAVVLKLWICGLRQNRSLALSAASLSSVRLAPLHDKCKNKRAHTSDEPPGTLFDKCRALYFSHQKWNITLSHSLKSTKANYPSFTPSAHGAGELHILRPRCVDESVGR